jgi:transposase
MARYDLSEAEWRVVEPLLPNKPRGVARVDDRRVINGIFYILRTGSPSAFGGCARQAALKALAIWWLSMHRAVAQIAASMTFETRTKPVMFKAWAGRWSLAVGRRPREYANRSELKV